VALEAAKAVRERLRMGLRVVAFSAEEGATFGRPCLGSELATGTLPAAELDGLRDADGVAASERAAYAGLAPADCRAWITTDTVAAFLELHIEQGGVLESENVRIGVVDAIAGRRGSWSRAADGRAIRERRRCACAPTRSPPRRSSVLAVEASARRSHGVVATVGRLLVSPNGVTTIPSDVDAVIDVRGFDPLQQEGVVAEIDHAARELAARRGIEIEVRRLSWRDP